MFVLTIRDGGDAFHPDPAPEVARLLREAADKIERDGYDEFRLMDENGNQVGIASTDESRHREARTA